MINPYGLLLSLSAFLSLLLIKKRAKLYNLQNNHLENIFLLSIVGGVVGARIYHVIDKWSYYQNRQEEMLYLWQGGLGIYGALIGGFLSLWVYTKLRNLNFFQIADLISPALPLSQFIGRAGNYFNREGFGPPTDLPWKVFIPPEKRPTEFFKLPYFHPTFFYEALLCLILFIALMKLSKILKKNPGALFGVYLVGYGLIRSFTEVIRLDTAQFLGIKTAFIFSFISILIGLFLILRAEYLAVLQRG